ncbi:MAG: carboxypeptidase-like regulatory domain-containing protein [Acidobacteriota bacterium]
MKELNATLSVACPKLGLLSVALRGVTILVWGIVLFPLAQLEAQTLRGTVINGTTNQPSGGQKVELLVLDQGMQTASEATTGPDGSFTFASVPSGQTPHILLRIIHQGVNYNLSVMSDQVGKQPVTLTIYETTQDPGAVDVSLPVMLAQASGKDLLVQQQYLVTNNTRPPKTLVSPYGTFLFDTPPADRVQELTVSVVGLAGIPLPQIPSPRKDGGYLINYPMKPGVNEVRVSYTVRGSDGARELKHRLFQGTQNTRMIVLPNDLKVSGSHISGGGTDERTQGAVYQLAGIDKGGILDVMISGDAPLVSDGDGHNHDEESGDPDFRVVRLPNPVYEKKLFIFAGFGVLFVIALALALRQRSTSRDETKVQRRKRKSS